MVRITDQGQYAYFLGDILPSPNQLNRDNVSAGHTSRMQTKKIKLKLIRQAYEENALLLFYHSLSAKPGRLAKNNDEQYVLKEVDK